MDFDQIKVVIHRSDRLDDTKASISDYFYVYGDFLGILVWVLIFLGSHLKMIFGIKGFYLGLDQQGLISHWRIIIGWRISVSIMQIRWISKGFKELSYVGARRSIYYQRLGSQLCRSFGFVRLLIFQIFLDQYGIIYDLVNKAYGCSKEVVSEVFSFVFMLFSVSFSISLYWKSSIRFLMEEIFWVFLIDSQGSVWWMFLILILGYIMASWTGVSWHQKHFHKAYFSFSLGRESIDFFESLIKQWFFRIIWLLHLFTLKMSQSGLVKKTTLGMSQPEGKMSLKLKVTVPRFDNSALIQGYSKTLIGRCMNPSAQEMKNLLYMLPRIWKLEDRVAGADLGLGRFQFDFDNEEDIIEVMKMAPFHFDHWMLSVVRWKPVVDRNYPSAITFWIRVMGVPLHFWAEETFKSIGDALGEFQGVDLDTGMVQVTIDGFKPLIFETMVEFHSGEETVVSLWYERLFGYCRRCFSMCHDETKCLGDGGVVVADGSGGSRSSHGPKMLSYKAAASQEPAIRQHTDWSQASRAQGSANMEQNKRDQNGLVQGGHEEQYFTWQNRGKRQALDARRDSKHSKHGKVYTWYKGKNLGTNGDGSLQQNKDSTFIQHHDNNLTYVMPTAGINNLKHQNMGKEFSVHEQKMLDAFHGIGLVVEDKASEGNKEKGGSSKGYAEVNKARKELIFESETLENDAAGDVLKPVETDAMMPFEEERAEEEMANLSKATVVGLVDTLMEDHTYGFGVKEDGVFLGEQGEIYDGFSHDHSEATEVIEEEVNMVLTEEAEKQGAKKRLFKSVQVLNGISSKKRYAQILKSPRKIVSSKNQVRFGEGLYSSAATGVGKAKAGGDKPGVAKPSKRSDEA